MSDERDVNGGPTDEEKMPMNNAQEGTPGEGQETVVMRQPTRTREQKKGCFITHVQGAIVVVVIVVVIVLLAVIAALLATNDCSCDEDSRTPGPLPSTTPRPTLDPSLPWSDLRLPRNILPSYYHLELTVNLVEFTFSGSVDIDFDCVEDTDIVIVHTNALEVEEREVSIMERRTGEKVNIARQRDVRLNQFHVIETSSDLKKNRKYRLSFRKFTGRVDDDLKGLYRSVYKDRSGRTRYLAASQLQSVDARKVFPCFDEPDLKANFSVVLTHSPDYTALANMPLKRNMTLSNGWVREEFEVTPIMSTYLLAFVIADFRHREKITSSGLKIRIWAQPDMYDQTAYALEFAEQTYDFFADYFGMPEVVPKADHVAVPDFSAGAMENWGLVLYRETALLYDEDVSAIHNKYYVSLVIAHEIAHTWFGNMVTMKWWDDLWLNEGFANTLMFFALNTSYPNWNVFDLQLVFNVYSVMIKDSLVTSHAISTSIDHPDEITQFFDSISYDKGMAVLRLLRGFLGWRNFQTGLQRYVQNYKFKNADMSELWKTFEDSNNSNFEIGKIMDTWTRQMGFPVVTFTKLSDTRYLLEQSRFLLNPDADYNERESPFRYEWIIPFIYKIQGDNREYTTWMERSSAEIEVPRGAWIIGNLDYMGYFRTNYDLDMWRRLTEQLERNHTVFSAANRAGLINDAFNLARAHKLPYDVALNLTRYLDNEEDFVPWKAFLDSMRFLQDMLATSNSYGKLQRYIYEKVSPQYLKLRTPNTGPLLLRNLAREIVEAACNVGLTEAITWASNTFNLWYEFGNEIAPDYAAVIYSVGIRQSGELQWNHLWEEAQKTKVASEADMMMSALAFTQEPWLLWRYARWSLDSSKIRMQDVRNLFSYFAATPQGRSVALQFLLTNWEDINNRFGMDGFLLREIIHATTSTINTEYELTQIYRLYADRPPAGVASKAAANSLALIRSNIKWMNLNHGPISSWLDRHVTMPVAPQPTQ